MSQNGRYFNSNFPPGSVVQTLTGNSGGAVGPDAGNDINVVGDGTTITIVGNPGTNTLTASAMGSVALQFDEDSGSAIPALGVIDIAGGTNITTSGATSIVTINLDDAISLATSVTSPLYLAPGLGNINLRLNDTLGANYVNITDSASTTVASIDSLGNAIFTMSVTAENLMLDGNTISSTNANGNIVLDPNGSGTVRINYATANTVTVYGTSGALSGLGPLTNGQLVIGSTGVAPVAGSITSTGGTITVTLGAGTINLESSGTTIIDYTNVSTSPYVVLTTDTFLSVDCSGGAITLQFPNAASTGRAWIVKDRTGNANTNNITLTTVGGAVNIDGATTYVMNTQYASVSIVGNSSTYELY